MTPFEFAFSLAGLFLLAKIAKFLGMLAAIAQRFDMDLMDRIRQRAQFTEPPAGDDPKEAA